MEQITLTKEELKEIIAKEVRNAIKGEKPISSGAIFSKVRINNDDLEEINNPRNDPAFDEFQIATNKFSFF